MQRTGWIVAGVTALALAGCGGSDEDAVKETVSTYLSAIANGDGDQACDQLTGEAKRGFVDAIMQQVPELGVTSCPDAISALSENLGADETDSLEDVEFESVTIDGDSATARPKDATSDAELTKTDGEWLISGGLGF